MEFHPIADEWPLLAGAEFDALVESVTRYGVKVPGWKYEGKILDGRNRYRAAEAAGVRVLNWHTFEGTEEQARDLARLLNDDRRHEDRMQRAERVRRLREKGLSTRAIADVVGVSPATVRNDLNSGGQHCPPDPEQEPEPCATTPTTAPARSSAPSSPAFVSPPAPPRVTGLDGKKYAATRPQPNPAPEPVRPRAPDAAAWAEFFGKLASASEFATQIRSQTVPQEMESWQLVNTLEQTARSLLAAAKALRASPR